MLALSNSHTFLATFFHNPEPSRKLLELAHWEGIRESLEDILESVQNTSSNSFLLNRDPITNQCTLYIRTIKASDPSGYNTLIENWKEMSDLFPVYDFSITKLYSTEKKSYTACIQASSPERMEEGLRRLLRVHN